MGIKSIISLGCVLAFMLVGCSKSSGYSSKEAVKKGDVVFLNEVVNFERFQQFLTNFENNKKDSIRVTGYTDEGDPIFKDLQYDGQVIHYTYDNSNDAHGGRKKGQKTDDCTRITAEENLQGEIDYVISGCTKNSSDISYFLLRVKNPSN